MENDLPTHIQWCDRGILILCWTWMILWCTPVRDIHDIMKDDQSGCSALYRNDCHICLDSRTYLTYYWWLWCFSAYFYKRNIVFCLCHLQLSRSVYSNSTELLLVLFVRILFSCANSVWKADYVFAKFVRPSVQFAFLCISSSSRRWTP
jgi:hypothetical protein